MLLRRGEGRQTALTAILLQPCRAQSAHAMRIDQPFPGKKLVGGELVALASLLKRQQAGTDTGDNFGFAANHPTLGFRCRKIV